MRKGEGSRPWGTDLRRQDIYRGGMRFCPQHIRVETSLAGNS
jgi:hypothetical protein